MTLKSSYLPVAAAFCSLLLASCATKAPSPIASGETAQDRQEKADRLADAQSSAPRLGPSPNTSINIR